MEAFPTVSFNWNKKYKDTHSLILFITFYHAHYISNICLPSILWFSFCHTYYDSQGSEEKIFSNFGRPCLATDYRYFPFFSNCYSFFSLSYCVKFYRLSALVFLFVFTVPFSSFIYFCATSAFPALFLLMKKDGRVFRNALFKPYLCYNIINFVFFINFYVTTWTTSV